MNSITHFYKLLRSVVKSPVNDEALKEMLSVAQALSHDIKGAVGTISTKMTLTLQELRNIKEQSLQIDLLSAEVQKWKRRIAEIYIHAEELTIKVRNGEIISPVELSRQITKKLIEPLTEIQTAIDSQQRNIQIYIKKDLVRLKEARTAVYRVTKILDGLAYDLREDNSNISYVPTNLLSHAKRAEESLFQLITDTASDITIRGNASMKADQASILVLLINLIENAIKYKKPDTKAEIEISLAEERLSILKPRHEELFKKNISPEDWISIVVSDNGIGIPENERELVFDMGYRVKTDKNIQGSGYGLARVRAIIRRHRGKYLLETSEKGGLKFTCFFPTSQNGSIF